jgi:glycosyltransferase involved in cell wall biosynthesis
VIGVNGSFLTANVTGVQRYAFQLLVGLIEEAPRLHLRVYVPSAASGVPLLDDLRQAGADVVPAPSWASNKQIFEQLALPRMASRDGVTQLLHLSNSVSLLSRIRQVCFLYDLSPVRFSHTFRPAYRVKFRAVLAGARLHKARIATLSEFSRKELQSVGLHDITVVPAGLGSPMLLGLPPCDSSDASLAASQKVEGPYALILASSDPRKRVQDVAATWPAVYADSGLTLVVVGGAPGVHRSSGGQQSGKGVVNIEGRVSDRELVQLIRGSHLVVFASAYEGGALAAQEAMALGGRVVVSDIPTFRELLPPSVPFFDNLDVLSTRCAQALGAPRPPAVSRQEASASWREAGALVADLLAEEFCAT